ncbi:MAG: DUF1570 domain-containing protein [Planctomycetes bacterium]|nr:DUF1570 domain-containing protein [Planctomycetota bacterium]
MLSALVLTLLLCSPPQNRAHPGLVPLGKDEWGTPAQAKERGLILYHDQWLPKEREKDLRKWEKEDAKEGLDWKHRYKTKSEYYRIETNVPRWRIELEIKPFLDELFETHKRVMAEDFGISGKAAGNKDVRIYSSFNDYSVNEPDNGKPHPRNNPGFIVGGATLVVYYEETDPGEFYWVCFHEGAHQFFLSLLPGATPPHWLTEALATYFEGCTYSRATGTVTPGFVNYERLTQAQGVLKSRKDATAQELFLDVPGERFGGFEYGLAWSFVHYLIHRPGEKSREHFASFVRELNGSGVKPAGEVFAKATKEDFDALIPGWKDYVLALQPPPPIAWVALNVTKAKADEDLRSKDLVWSFDGVEVYSVKQYGELWMKRPKDRSYEVVVVRCEPDFSSPQATRRFVHTTIQPGSEIQLQPLGELQRKDGLSD